MDKLLDIMLACSKPKLLQQHHRRLQQKQQGSCGSIQPPDCTNIRYYVTAEKI
jgi:hypothetical protein